MLLWWPESATLCDRNIGSHCHPITFKYIVVREKLGRKEKGKERERDEGSLEDAGQDVRFLCVRWHELLKAVNKASILLMRDIMCVCFVAELQGFPQANAQTHTERGTLKQISVSNSKICLAKRHVFWLIYLFLSRWFPLAVKCDINSPSCRLSWYYIIYL